MSLRLVAQIDSLFEQAVSSPTSIDDASLGEWAEVAFEDAHGDREVTRAIRRAVRTARKLAKYWSDRDSEALPDWRNGVDEALGGLGWQAQLDLLVASLDVEPDPEVFEAVRERHRQVHFTEWMEGVEYDDWLAERVGPSE